LDDVNLAEPRSVPIGRAALSGLCYLTSLLAVAVLVLLASLIVWTLIPMTFGWSSSVVLTGSMRPAVAEGDVIVSAPVKGGQVRAGYVVRFQDPAEPGRYLLHRIVAVEADGYLISKGDANQSADSTPVPPQSVTGMARLRVPWVGLPNKWLHDGDYTEFGLFCAALVILCALVPVGWNRAPAPSSARHRQGRSRPGRRRLLARDRAHRCRHRRGATVP
jgi:signal peptidase